MSPDSCVVVDNCLEKIKISHNGVYVKWFDNKPVQLIYSRKGDHPVGIWKRLSPKDKAYTYVH